MQIRQATLDDVQGIHYLFRAQIDRWQRMTESGQVEDLSYEQLSIYERWLHGGAWMAVETGAIWLSHLLRGAGTPLVLVDSHQVMGYVETYSGNEPEPYQIHTHLGALIASNESVDDGREILLQHILTQAGKGTRITVSSTPYDEERLAFYKRYGFVEMPQVKQFNISAASGSIGFYQANEHLNADPNQIKGWMMPVGRRESARCHWEQLWANLWQGIPEVINRRTHRQRFSASGQEAFVYLQQHLYIPRAAEVSCWTAKPLSGQLVSAIRDWAYKQGYRTLMMTVNDATAKALGGDTESTPYQHLTLGRVV
jgi:hypothetical protein